MVGSDNYVYDEMEYFRVIIALHKVLIGPGMVYVHVVSRFHLPNI